MTRPTLSAPALGRGRGRPSESRRASAAGREPGTALQSPAARGTPQGARPRCGWKSGRPAEWPGSGWKLRTFLDFLAEGFGLLALLCGAAWLGWQAMGVVL